MRIIDPQTGKAYVEKRRQRYDECGEPRELTFSCYRRFPFLSRARTRAWFRDALDAARKRFGFQIWAYVLMPEHVHLLVYPGSVGKNVSKFLQAIKQPVARKAIVYVKKNAPQWLPRLQVYEGRCLRHRFWQPGGGYDRNVTTTQALRAMIEYIHANPVRRGLVARAEDWEWSSARWYAGLRPVPISIDGGAIHDLVWG